MDLEANQKILAAKISWENILSSLPDGVVVIDARGRISFLNPAAETLTSVATSQAVGQPYARVFEKNPWLLQMVKRCQLPSPQATRGEGDLMNRWGRRLPVNLTVAPLQDPQGAVLGSILLLRDLTRRRELEEDLQRSDRLAELGTLAAGLAHEIRNPLAGIRGAAQLLKRELAHDSPLTQHTDIMIREVDRVNHLIEQLLDLSRPVPLSLTCVNIHQVLEDVLLLESQTFNDGSVEVKKNFDPSLPPVRADRDQLTQVFLNLVRNAFQAMNGKGCLTVTTRMETDFHIRKRGRSREKLIRVEVSDTGPGIKEEHLQRIFSPFFTTKTGGSGLGLTICHRIIREHGGFIRVESDGERGASFKISLPVADGDELPEL